MATMHEKSLLKTAMGNINLKEGFETQPAEWYELPNGTLHHKDSQEILDWPRLPSFENPRIGTCVLVYSERRGKYLLGRRGKESHGAGQLAAPGGHLELNETLEQCATREVKEETGLTLKSPRLLCTTCDNFAFLRQARGGKPEVKTLRNYITCWMVGLMADPEAEAKLLEPNKCEGWEWISIQQLRDHDQAPNDERPSLFLCLRSLLKQRPGFHEEVMKAIKEH